jgi:hypothetical protein
LKEVSVVAQTDDLDRLIQQVVAQVRWRRAEHYGLRGAFYGALVAVALLLVRHVLGPWAPLAAAGAFVLGALWGGLVGFSKRVPSNDAARLADRAFGLDDRVATAIEWAGRPDRSPLVDALIADATARVQGLQARQIVRRRGSPEGRLVLAPVLVGVALMLAPPIPLPALRLPDLSVARDEEKAQERGDAGVIQEASRTLPKDALRRPSFEERDFAQRSGAGGPATAGDLSAIFKDTSLGNQRPDFNSFLKKGDERLRMLEQVDRLPDLASDFTASQYKMVYRKSKELRGGLSPDISPQKLKELLEEMERLGRKGGNWSPDASEGLEALEGGEPDRAMQAMEKALNKMRAREEQQRSGKGLRGGREGDRGSRSRDRSGQGGEGGPDDMDFGEGEGLMPGKGKSASPKGEASQRVRGNPYDVGVEGESRRGRKDGYDTNLTGRGGQMTSRLQYLGVMGQYRKMMEDAITREAVPRDYHGQIKDYFQALDER